MESGCIVVSGKCGTNVSHSCMSYLLQCDIFLTVGRIYFPTPWTFTGGLLTWFDGQHPGEQMLCHLWGHGLRGLAASLSLSLNAALRSPCLEGDLGHVEKSQAPPGTCMRSPWTLQLRQICSQIQPLIKSEEKLQLSHIIMKNNESLFWDTKFWGSLLFSRFKWNKYMLLFWLDFFCSTCLGDWFILLHAVEYYSFPLL